MARPQNSPRGLFAKQAIQVGNTLISYNSTGLKLDKPLIVNGQPITGLISANSTALLLPNGIRIGPNAAVINSNSTGIRIGTKYISTNDTGN